MAVKADMEPPEFSIQSAPTADSIVCTLYRNNEQPVVVNKDNIANVIVETNPHIVFIIHGFTQSADSPWKQAVKDNLLTYYAHANFSSNIITVDWKELAAAIQDPNDFWNHPIYFKAATNTRDYVAPFLRDLISSISSKFVMCIGQSLGAQACGAFGRAMSEINSPIDVIHALDPAGPAFDNGWFNLINVNKNDSKFVSAIHTDSYNGTNIFGVRLIHFGTGVGIFMIFFSLE